MFGDIQGGIIKLRSKRILVTVDGVPYSTLGIIGR